MNEIGSKRDIIVWPSCMLEDGNNLWMFHGKINVLLKYDIRNDAIEVKGSLQGEELIQEYIIGSMCKLEQYIYLFPLNGRHIHRFDMYTEEFEKVDFPCVSGMECKQKFRGAHLVNNNAIIVTPVQYPYILKIEAGNCDTIIRTDVSKQIEEKGIVVPDNYYLSESVMLNRSLLSVIENTGYVVKYDIETNEILFLDLGKNNRHFFDIRTNGEKLALGTYFENEVVIFNSQFLEETNIILDEIESFLLQSWEDKIVVDSETDGRYIVYEYSGKAVYRNNLNKLINKDISSFAYSYGLGYKGKKRWYYYDRHECYLFINDMGEIINRRITVKRNDIKKIEGIIIENSVFDLQWMLEIIETDNGSKDERSIK